MTAKRKGSSRDKSPRRASRAPAEPDVPARRASRAPAEPDVPARRASRAPAEPDVPARRVSRAPAEPDVPARRGRARKPSRASPERRRGRAGGRDVTGQDRDDRLVGSSGGADLPGRATLRRHEREFLRLSELLRDDLVKTPLSAGDRWGAVDELIRLLVVRGEVPPALAEGAAQAVREREAIRPTGWKYGLAFPNGRVSGLKRIAAAIGVLPAGVEFGCRDGLPAQIVVLLLFPDACYARFAPAIEDIAETFEDAPLRETVLGARGPAEIVEAIEDAESREFA